MRSNWSKNTLTVLLAAFCVWMWGSLFQAARTRYLANRHAAVIRRHLGRHPEFSRVKSEANSQDKIAVHGWLARKKDRPRLEALVDETKPPVAVHYYLRYKDAPTKSGAAQQDAR